MYKVQAQKTETWEERQSSLREERKAAQFIKRWCKWSVWRFFYLSVSFFFPFVFIFFKHTKKLKQFWQDECLCSLQSERKRSRRTCGECVACVRTEDCGQCDFCKVLCYWTESFTRWSLSLRKFYLNLVKHSCLISPPGLLHGLGKEEISF